jgi:two-component system sensor histidine kinase KdpD
MTTTVRSRPTRRVLHLAASLAAVALITLLYRWLHVTNAATISATFLLIVLVVAAAFERWIAVVTSITAMLSFNFFFLPPVGTLTIADPANWVALAAFLAVGVLASHLSAVARAGAAEARARRDELTRLFDLSRDVLVMTDRDAIAGVARSVARRFDLSFVAIALPHEESWDVFASGGRPLSLETMTLTEAFADAQRTLEFDAYARTYAGHRTLTIEGQSVRLVPLRVGTKPIGLLAAAGRPIEPGSLDALAGVVAIAIERAQFLDERRAAALTRQSEELKSALLASLAHDLRTPLTAIRVAAGNIKLPGLSGPERLEQSDVILSETERLTRLFQNILDMARLDAGAVTAEARVTHPSEIVAAARAQVEQMLQAHPVDVSLGDDPPVRLDPRLIATALAHLLENAAQYAPAGSPIHVTARLNGDALTIAVRDEGPGLSPGDLPRVFERFYRGDATRARRAGTGMGLAIARGLLAVAGGRIWAENPPQGGALFTFVVPATAASMAAPVAAARS